MRCDIGDPLRRLVAERASYRCEYCLIHEQDSFTPHQVDHVISRKHGGPSTYENLAYSCVRCNCWKGSDIGSFDHRTQTFVGFFNPRRHRWTDHFLIQGFTFEPLTAEGHVTSRILRLNVDRRVVERRRLAGVGRYPP